MTLGTDDKVTKLPDFTAYSSQIAKVTPSAVSSSNYSPTNTARACPNADSNWDVSETLPPSPNNGICSCMVQNLTCIATPGLSDETIRTQFDFVCDPNNGDSCIGISTNANTGVYGAYSMCNAEQKLSWAFNVYYRNQTANNPANTSPCDFDGAGRIQRPNAPSSCRAAASQAGAAGNGVVTSLPSGTGSGSSASSEGAAGAVSIPNFDFGMVQLAVYVLVATLTGAGMVWL